eukprot:3657093-Rhodomonas_salina.2
MQLDAAERASREGEEGEAVRFHPFDQLAHRFALNLPSQAQDGWIEEEIYRQRGREPFCPWHTDRCGLGHDAICLSSCQGESITGAASWVEVCKALSALEVSHAHWLFERFIVAKNVQPSPGVNRCKSSGQGIGGSTRCGLVTPVPAECLTRYTHLLWYRSFFGRGPRLSEARRKPTMEKAVALILPVSGGKSQAGRGQERKGKRVEWSLQRVQTASTDIARPFRCL